MERGARLTIHPADTVATLYLVAPLIVFLAFFIRLEIAIPACALVAIQVYTLIRRTAWREAMTVGLMQLYFLILAALWIFLSGGIGPLPQNGDWWKHYAVVNFLTQHTWPATTGDPGGLALRYYIGWYLIPSLALKATGGHFQTIFLSVWSLTGVFLFFNLLPALVGKRLATIGAPLVFVFFSGSDLIGTSITKFNVPDLEPYHFEWWAGWVQYSSTTTAIFWVPQHAIAAWIGTAILMRTRDDVSFLPYLGLLLSSVLIWSPFSAIGMAPFLIALAIRHGVHRIIADWRPVASALLLAMPVAMYLVSGPQKITMGFITHVPCGMRCFTWPSYALFLVIEVGLPLLILFLIARNQRGFLAAAAITLCLIPIYRIGTYNDFAMRASLPALAVVAILCAKEIFSGSLRWSAAIVVVLLMGLPTPIGEIYRAFLPISGPSPSPDAGFSSPLPVEDGYYFAPLPIWILR